MSETIPQWAWDRALELVNADGDAPLTRGNMGAYRISHAFARYIAVHEEPPVDPLLIEARKLFAEDHRNGSADFFDHGVMLKDGAGESVIMAGKMDGNWMLRRYLRALERGMELAGGQP